MRRLLPFSLCIAVGIFLATLTRAQTTTPAIVPTTAAATAPTSRPAADARAKHAVIFSIDGCRPDVLLRSKATAVHEMMAQGAYSLYAETTDVAITLPSHTSFLTGVQPKVHGIDFNADPPDDKLIYPKVPTIFTLAHDYGMTTGVFSTKSKFRVYTPPGIVDYSFIIDEDSSADDFSVAEKAVEAIKQHKPGVMMVHFGNTDKVGHARGWGTPDQIAAIEGADKGVGMVIQALKDAGILDQTLIILTADHGGSGTGHGANDPRSRYIPWIAMGPGIRKGYDLTNARTLTIHTEDTFATACFFLGINPPAGIYGKPITQALQPPPGRGRGRGRAGTAPATGPATVPGT